LSGGAGNDRLDGGAGRNIYEGGPGNDFIDAANGAAERVGCGPGRDTVIADARDRLFNCERIQRLRRARG
jgi:Ca2+-binding RTX toxin-like protein